MFKSNENLTEQITKTMIDTIKKRERNKEELREVPGASFSDLSPGAVRKRIDRFLRRYLIFDLIDLIRKDMQSRCEGFLND